MEFGNEDHERQNIQHPTSNIQHPIRQSRNQVLARKRPANRTNGRIPIRVIRVIRWLLYSRAPIARSAQPFSELTAQYPIGSAPPCPVPHAARNSERLMLRMACRGLADE